MCGCTNPGASATSPHLPPERVLAPGRAVRRPLDDDLRPLGRHRSEQAVAANRPERRDRAQQRVRPGGHRRRPAHLADERECTQQGQDRRDADQHPIAGATVRPRPDTWRRRRHPPPERQRIVIEHRDVQHDGQQVEKSVVPRQRDHDLQRTEHAESDDPQAPEPRRQEDRERRDELDGEHLDGRRAPNPIRQVVRVPAHPCRNRLRLVVVRQRRQSPPGGIAAQQLRDSRQKRQLERQPPDQPPHGCRRLRRARPKRRPPRHRRVEHRQHPRFEQQDVPLKRQEVLPRNRQRQVADPEQQEDRNRRDPCHRRHRQRDSAPAQREQPAIPRPDPEQRRQLPVRVRPKHLVRAFQIRRHRQQSVIPDESGDLRRERRERRQVHKTEQPEEEESRPCKGRWGGRRHRGHAAIIGGSRLPESSCWEVVQW